MSALGQVAGNVGQADADKNDVAALQGARGIDDHQFRRRVIYHFQEPP
jgi:hypothetical protein